MESDYYSGDHGNGDYHAGYKTSTGTAVAPNPMMIGQDQEVPAMLGVGVMGFVVFMFLFVVAVYVFHAVCFQRMARKMNIEDDWYAWIPILNIILILKVANRPTWWIFLMFVPLLNIVINIIVWMDVAKAMGKPEWWGILILVPIVNLVVVGYLAFSDEVVTGYGDNIAPIQGNGEAFAYNSTVVEQSNGSAGEQPMNQLEQDLQKLQQEQPSSSAPTKASEVQQGVESVPNESPVPPSDKFSTTAPAQEPPKTKEE